MRSFFSLVLIGMAGVLAACGEEGVAPVADEAPQGPPESSTSPPSDDTTSVPSQPATPGDLANVYLSDPIGDMGMLSQVTLPRMTSADGSLSNAFTATTNCINEDGGPKASRDLGGFQLSVQFCHEVQTALPDAAGNYLSIVPPADDSDPNDPFAEVMMYYHVNQIHDFFHDKMGFTGLDYPLPAIVNVQFKIDPPIPFLMPGPDGWLAFPNAAFFPKEQWNQLASTLGLPTREADAIIFGQAQADFAYDAHVIYHEYTHAMIGTGRLSGRSVDAYGLDESPRSMNEGLADYFAATKSNDPIVGRYGIGKLDASLVRDLTAARRCPDDLTAEVHADGKIIGSALWAVRGAIGAERTDKMVFQAIEQSSEATSLEQFGALVVAEARRSGDEVASTVESILERHGVLGCVRTKAFQHFVARESADRLPYPVEGTQSAEFPAFDAWAPGFFGFHFEVPAGQPAVRLRWTLGAGRGLEALGGFGGSPSAPPKLALAVRRGAPVQLRLEGASAAREEDALFRPVATQGPSGAANQSITLDSSCFPSDGGRVYVLFLNEGAQRVNIDSMDLDLLPVADVDTSSVARCPSPPAP